MNELLEDWHNYCQGKCELDKSHFLGLFKTEMTDAELASVFRYFSSAEEMDLRLRKVIEAGYLGAYVYLQRPTLLERADVAAAASAWIQEQGRFCIVSGEETSGRSAVAAKPVFVDKEAFEQARAHAQPEAEISDHIVQTVWWSVPDEPESIFALIEALYGLAADYNLAWYVVQPLLTIDLNFALYFEFWRRGGAGVLTEVGYLIRSED